MLPPKTSHHAKFHRDLSNQLGDRGGRQLGLGQFFFILSRTDFKKRDYLSLDSQRARGATKKLIENLFTAKVECSVDAGQSSVVAAAAVACRRFSGCSDRGEVATDVVTRTASQLR